MSKKLSSIKTDKLLRLLFKHGFQPRRKKGSHLILYKENNMLVIPIHKGKDVPEVTLNSILKKAGIKKEDINK